MSADTSIDETPLTPQEAEDQARYRAAAHAVQSATAFEMGLPGHDASAPKHLRVGIDMCFVSLDALQRLCMEKGLFTRAELFAANADAAEREVRLREASAQQILGTEVRFS